MTILYIRPKTGQKCIFSWLFWAHGGGGKVSKAAGRAAAAALKSSLPTHWRIDRLVRGWTMQARMAA